VKNTIDAEHPMITKHFSFVELNLQGATERVVENYIKLCEQVMEPIREKFGPLVITSGYRYETLNNAVGGKPDSFHLGFDGKAAIDFRPFRKEKLLHIWDWLRLDSDLLFDKIILERDKHDAQTPVIIHVQLDTRNPPRRLAYEGFTGAGTSYTAVNVNPLKNLPITEPLDDGEDSEA